MLSLAIIILLVLSILPSGIVTASTPTAEQVNDYSLEVASFVKEKCHGSCEDIVILGDDYVVPSFRRDIKMSPWYELWDNWFTPRTDNILTDIGYVQRKGVTFDEFDKLFVKKSWMGQESKGKDAVFIIPTDASPALKLQINRLGDVLKNKSLALDITTKYDNEIACNDPQLWYNFNDVTLFIFGTNNQALNCFPFVAKLEDTAFIDVNPWDGKSYAVILQTIKPEIIQMFKVIVENDKYKMLQSEWITFVDTGLMIASIAAAFFGADRFVDGVDWTFQCGIVKNVIACGASGVAFAVDFVPSGAIRAAIKRFTSAAGEVGEKFLLKYGDNGFIMLGRVLRKGGLEAIDNLGFYMKRIGNYFGDNWDNIAKNLNWGAADEVLASQGAKRVGNLDNFAPHLAKEVQADLLHSIGKVDESLKLGDNAVKEIRFVSSSDEALGTALASFDPDEGIVYISKSANVNDVKKFLVAHEMAHAKVVEQVGDIVKMVDGMSYEKADIVIKQFDEFLADNLAKDKLGADFVLKKLTNAEIIGGDGTEIARHLALARTYDPAEAERILNLVSQQRYAGDKIIHLSETFMENSNIAAIKNNPSIITKLAEESKEVIEKAIGTI